MKESKNHIDIDMEFLDRKEPLRVAPKPDFNTGSVPASTSPKYKWKNILIIGGVILFFIWVGSSGNNSTTNTSSSSTISHTSNSDTVTVGQYSCSSYNASKADSMKPNTLLKQQIDAYEARSATVETSAKNIDSMYVDETSQYSIDNYNRAVNGHNAQVASLKKDSQSYTANLSQYNSQVDAYNNFLQTNCTRN